MLAWPSNLKKWKPKTKKKTTKTDYKIFMILSGAGQPWGAPYPPQSYSMSLPPMPSGAYNPHNPYMSYPNPMGQGYPNTQQQYPGKNSQFHTEFSWHIPICSESSRIENNLANHQTSQQQWCFWRDFESFFKWWNVYMNTATGRVMFSILSSDL